MVKIAIIGGGIIGLTTALALLESGDYKDVEVIASSYDNTVSHVAGAIWLPFALPKHVNVDRISEWCDVSINWLSTLEEEKGQSIGLQWVKGVSLFYNADGNKEAPYWAQFVRNFRHLTSDEVKEMDIKANVNAGFEFESIMCSPTQFISYLKEQILSLGGKLTTRTINTLDEVRHAVDEEKQSYSVVVNCTGLAAKELANDDTVYPVRGQIIMINNPKFTNFAMISEPDHSDHGHTYILPRCNGEIVVGGTVQDDDWEENNRETDVDLIWERAVRYFPVLSESKRLRNVAGLRPQRKDSVRLEVETRNDNGALLIHNYGHSGSGHTIHWGCAQRVVQLVNEQLRI